VLFNSSQGQAGRLISGLLDGRSPVVRHSSGDGRVSEVRLLPVKFSKAFNDYQTCVAKLLPQNSIRSNRRRSAFPAAASIWMPRGQLQVMLEYMKADPTVNHIELDGHSDNSGNRLTNRDLSRRRAWRS
jgi:outer membrane protein OmpA-like peptidoglycan-associated protein